MALTAEVLKQQEVLKSLTDDQLTAISNLSKNDETTVIGKEMGTILGSIDSVILELTGKNKPHGMKTSDFVKTELSSLKAAGNSSELITKLNRLQQEKADLENQIANGSLDTALKGKVSSLEQQLLDRTTSIEQLQTKLNSEKEKYQSDLEGLKWQAEFGQALNGFAYKSEDIIPKALRDSHLLSVKQAVKGRVKMDFVDQGGVKKTVYRNEDGILITSPNDPSQPASLLEIMTPDIAPIMATGHTAAGAGTQAAGAGKGAAGSISISGAKTKVEATAMIEKQLATQGIARNTAEYQTKLKEAYSQNDIAALPLI